MSNINLGILAVIVAYLIFMVVIGAIFTKKNKSTHDFYLGGRTLGPLVTAMSAEASDMSSWLLMGLPGVAYLSGCAEAAWTAIGLAIGTYLNWLIVARRLRTYTYTTESVTIPGFFSNRYGDRRKVLAAIAALVILIFFIPYTASGFAACGKLFQTLFGMDYTVAMLLSAAVIVVYCTLGGFLAASTTDLIQSIVMTVALVVVVFFGISTAGGISTVMDNAKALPGYLSLMNSYSLSDNTAQPYSVLTIASTLAWGLGYFGMPHILLRFMAIGDEKKLKLSRRVASVWVVISMAIAIFIGIIGYSMSQAGIIEAFTTSGQSETVIIRIAQVLAHFGPLAVILAGLIMAGILACTMSTSDSQLIAAASSVSEDIIQGLFGVKLRQKTAMIIARVTVVVLSLIAVLLARDPDSSVFRIVSFAWAGFGAAFGPVMLLALFWKRSNLPGAIAGMVAGGAMVFLWKYVIANLGGVFAIYELLPAFLFALVVNVVVSLLTKAPDQAITSTFEKVRAACK